MAEPDDPIAWYGNHAATVAADYEQLDPARVLDWLTDALPEAGVLILDVGAGTGRDAAWLSGIGHTVIAVEPAAALRAEARRLRPASAIQWIDDRLPALAATYRLGLAFDMILLGEVWQHVAPGDRPRALRKLLGLLKAGGVLAISLRHGPADDGRAVHAVSLAEVERLARDHGALVERVAETPDLLARPGVRWTGVVLRLPDDGTGALPILRHLILNDQKSATYELGLLRALCRAADGQAGLAVDRGDDMIELPLGIIALNWLRLYLPLVAAGLPQMPGNAGADGLGFAGPGFRTLLAGNLISRLDLRVGGSFSGDAGAALHSALKEAVDFICRMPARYLTYPTGGSILPTTRQRAPAMRGSFVADAAYLASFGTMSVPGKLWRAMGRFAAWVEPALVAEWSKLIRAYAARQDRTVDEAALSAAMVWSEPSRRVGMPRDLALGMIAAGGLRCAWTGRALSAADFDIDHCLPWSAWPCGDLWNLMPAHRTVNQRLKRDRLPGEAVLQAARPAIETWWTAAYGDGQALRQFGDEARASLPGLVDAAALSPGSVFDALRLQRLRLHQDQQVLEWHD